MPHDKNGQLLSTGDRVTLTGTILAITSEQPTYCNITLLTDEGMAPDVPGTSLALSARMVEKGAALAPRAPVGSTQDAHITLNKELRRDIDAIIQRLKSDMENKAEGNLNCRFSRERSLSITKLQEAVMWLGMDLKAINEESPGAAENPYPNSKDPSNTKIEPTADGLKL